MLTRVKVFFPVKDYVPLFGNETPDSFSRPSPATAGEWLIRVLFSQSVDVRNEAVKGFNFSWPGKSRFGEPAQTRRYVLVFSLLSAVLFDFPQFVCLVIIAVSSDNVTLTRL